MNSISILAARSLTEVLVSLATHLALLFVCIVIAGNAFFGLCKLLIFLFLWLEASGKKKGKVKLAEGWDFWMAWTVCMMITLFWVIDYLRSD